MQPTAAREPLVTGRQQTPMGSARICTARADSKLVGHFGLHPKDESVCYTRWEDYGSKIILVWNSCL